MLNYRTLFFARFLEENIHSIFAPRENIQSGGWDDHIIFEEPTKSGIVPLVYPIFYYEHRS